VSKAIVPVTSDTWEMIQAIAPVAATSRMFGVTKEQAAVVMLKGHELGLGIATAFEFVHVIDSKPSISPKGALALIHQSGELAHLEIHDLTDSQGNPTRCKVTMKRKNGFEYTTEYSMADAERAGVVKDKSGWDKYPANMLRWRAVGYCADVVFPDVVGGLYRPEELGAEVDADGEPVGKWEVVEAPPQTPPEKGGNGKGDPVQPASKASEPVEAKNEEAPAAAEPEKKVSVKPPAKQEAPPLEVNTVADILAAGFDVGAIQAAVTALKEDGQDVHFPPATSEECGLVMAKLQEVPSATD